MWGENLLPHRTQAEDESEFVNNLIFITAKGSAKGGEKIHIDYRQVMSSAALERIFCVLGRPYGQIKNS